MEANILLANRTSNFVSFKNLRSFDSIDIHQKIAAYSRAAQKEELLPPHFQINDIAITKTLSPTPKTKYGWINFGRCSSIKKERLPPDGGSDLRE